MKKILMVVSVLFLAACSEHISSVEKPKPAPLSGQGSEKVRVWQLNQATREALGAKTSSELIAQVGEDGTLSLFGAEGQGFKVEKAPIIKLDERGVVNHVSITVVKHSPTCNYVIFNGYKYWYPAPPCPI